MIIYKITNKLNGMVYVGQTVQTLKDRWHDHIRGDKQPTGYLHRAIKKYGVENFTAETIDSSVTVEGLNILEEHYIKKLNSLAPNGYNLLPGGSNRRCHEDTKQRISETLKGRPIPNRWNGGNHSSPSEETRAKISHKLQGRPIMNRWTGGNRAPRTEEQKAHLSALNKGKPNRALFRAVEVTDQLGVVTEYESVNAASLATNIHRGCISTLLKSGKANKKTGLRFKFKQGI